jgi:hypothetical protein
MPAPPKATGRRESYWVATSGGIPLVAMREATL